MCLGVLWVGQVWASRVNSAWADRSGKSLAIFATLVQESPGVFIDLLVRGRRRRDWFYSVVEHSNAKGVDVHRGACGERRLALTLL
jgi:hypothetical protein